MAGSLRRQGLPELADVALLELPDPVDGEQLESLGHAGYGVQQGRPDQPHGGATLESSGGCPGEGSVET